MSRCVIISGAPEFVLPALSADDFVIACDRGLEHAQSAGLRPDLFVGDMDSTSLVVEGVERILSVPEKDDTDTMMAVREAFRRGFTEFLLLASLGGRSDHHYANISAAAYIARHGGRCELVGRDVRMYVFADGELTLPRKTGWSLSVFSVSDRAEGVSIRGTKYPLEDAEMTNAFPLGVSNEFAACEAVISVRSGVLLVMAVKKDAKAL